MADKLCGKWKLIHADNVAEYCDALGCAEEYKNLALKLLSPSNDIYQEISLDTQTVSITTTMPGKTTKVSASLGSPFETQFLDGRAINSIFTVEGNQLKEQQTGSLQSTNVRYLEGDTMILAMTAGAVTSTRKYQRV